MPLREDILNPISEASPGGESLRYAPVYDKIKEARREDDDAAQGDWQRERKLADFPVVIKLASESIATKSKDLQLAAWLTEALLRRDGYGGLLEGLTLIKNLVETFWDTLWPEIDDGDVEMRAAPIDWVGQYLVISAKRVPLTRSGFDYLKYLEAKSVGREPAYEDSDDRKARYAEAVAEGKLTLDEFDKAVASTPKDFYERTVQAIDDCLQTMEDSQPLFEEKFGEYAPSYGKLRETIEEVRRFANTLLNAKIEAEGPAPEPEPVAQAEEAPAESSWETAAAEEPEAAPKRKVRRAVTSVEPADLDDAAARVAAAAAFWRQLDPYSPAPYLMLRGMRWGELRAPGTLEPNLFEAPSTETRTSLKRLMNEGSFAEAIEIAETAMAEPCGRAWLDLQRYVVTACDNLGYQAIATAIRSEVKALLADFPDLKTSTMLDDTPCANGETVRWLDEFATAEPVSAASAEAVWSAPPPAIEEPPTGSETETGPDTYQLAQEAAQCGRLEEAMDMMAGEIARQASGRGRFERKLQLAQICLAAGQPDIARAVLTELANAIDEHKLETWESAEIVAHALSLLYSCADLQPAEKAQLYARMCRLSPVQALRHGTQAFALGR